MDKDGPDLISEGESILWTMTNTGSLLGNLSNISFSDREEIAFTT